MAMDCCWFAGGNLPELRETTKMIEADEVAGLRGPTQPLHPPFVALRTHGVPVVKRISPTLARRAVYVRRHAGNRLRLEVVFQTKQFSICPYIGAVIIHKDGNVSDHPNRLLRAVETQGAPLLVKKELDDPAKSHFRSQFLARGL